MQRADVYIYRRVSIRKNKNLSFALRFFVLMKTLRSTAGLTALVWLADPI